MKTLIKTRSNINSCNKFLIVTFTCFSECQIKIDLFRHMSVGTLLYLHYIQFQLVGSIKDILNLSEISKKKLRN